MAHVYGFGESFRAIRACLRCGYERPIKIVPKLRNGVQVGEMSSSFCTACDREISAETHERMARKLRAQVAEIRARQRRHKNRQQGVR